MVEILAEPDCGNAPKREVLRDYEVALAEQDKATVLAAVADTPFGGKAAFAAALDAILDQRVATLRFDTILTHGPRAR